MKYFAVALAFLGLAAAQRECLSVVAQVPECGLGCIISAGAAVGCSNPIDFQCQCNSESYWAIQSQAQTCVISSCKDISTALMVQSVADNICSCHTYPAFATVLATGGTVPADATPAAPTESINTTPNAGAAPTGAVLNGQGDAAATLIGALAVALAAL